MVKGGRRTGAGRKSRAPCAAPAGTKWCPYCDQFVELTPENWYFYPKHGPKKGIPYGYCRACSRRRTRVFKKNQRDKWADRKARVVVGYGGKCKLCLEANPIVLILDHIIPADAKAERIKFSYSSGNVLYQRAITKGFPDCYQLLCLNCHAKKHHRRPRITESELKRALGRIE